MTALQVIVDALALGALFAVVALGISLLFGVMRMVNFAYGELITAAAYALVLTKTLAVPIRIAAAIAVAVALAGLMDLILRPFRSASPTTTLIATFALSFLLQNVAVLGFGTQGTAMDFLPGLNEAFSLGVLRIRWITVVSLAVGGGVLAAVALLLRRTDVGLRMRAAAADFTTARILGVRANRVITIAFVLTGLLAGLVTLALGVQRPLVTPSFGFNVLVPALVGVVVGGMDRLVAGTLGGFSVGFATVVLGQVLPAGTRVFLNSALFAIVIVVLLVRPNGLFVREQRSYERV
ncbi:MAG TPA: branched-chain amino acid ABC transporter permease [Acidimicrobiia bacterium]|nr:branched-chain amino acid ABC transporter permease [Acidimicrobiia bacterium]